MSQCATSVALSPSPAALPRSGLYLQLQGTPSVDVS